ncbi:MAG: peptide deformylase [Candidatus Brocadiia bacterium]
MSENTLERLTLKIYPDSVLTQVCDPVEKFDPGLKNLLEKMHRLMKSEEGIGLAAPQVGITKRFFVCRLPEGPISIINPKIESSKGNHKMVEGCLSMPYTRVNVARNQTVRVSGYDADGNNIQAIGKDLWAHILQHEIDHLNGVLISDHGKPISDSETGGRVS